MIQRDIAKNMRGEVPPLVPECGARCKTIHHGAKTSADNGDASTALFDNYGTINTEGDLGLSGEVRKCFSLVYAAARGADQQSIAPNC